MLTGSWDNTARLWDPRSGKPLSEPLRHKKSVTAAAFSPEGDRVLTGSEDNTARLWNARSGKPLVEPLRHKNSVTAAAFSPEEDPTGADGERGQHRAALGPPLGQALGDPLQHENSSAAA